MYSPSCHPRCWLICFIIRTDLEKFIITWLSQQWILSSEWVPSVRVQTADKNITIINTTPVHQLPSSEEKSCMFAKNHNHHLWWKYTSIIHNNASSSKKVHLLLSSQNICLELFWTVFTGAWSADFSPDSDCFTGESIWKEDSSRSNGLKIETFNDGFVSYKLHNMLIDVLSGVDYLWIIVMFLSAVWTLILTAPIHWRGSICKQVKFCWFSLTLINKQTHTRHWMAWRWVNYQQMLIFEWSIPLMIYHERLNKEWKLSQPALVSHTLSECQSVKRMRKEDLNREMKVMSI